MSGELDKFLEVAKKAALEAGKIQMDYFDKEKQISTKSTETDIVTQVDLLSQDIIVKIIKQDFPDHNFLAEEKDLDEKHNSKYTWIIDPIDGTVNYAHSIPMFCVSIGLKKDDKIVVGVVYVPSLDEMFWAVKGQGAFFNNTKINVSNIKKLTQSVVATGFAANKHLQQDNNTKEFCAVTNNVQGVRRLGSAAIDLCYTACGRLEGYWELLIKPWDIAAGVLILEEASGKITTVQGEEIQFQKDTSIIATNNHIHSKLSNLLAKARGGE